MDIAELAPAAPSWAAFARAALACIRGTFRRGLGFGRVREGLCKLTMFKTLSAAKAAFEATYAGLAFSISTILTLLALDSSATRAPPLPAPPAGRGRRLRATMLSLAGSTRGSAPGRALSEASASHLRSADTLVSSSPSDLRGRGFPPNHTT